MNRRPILHALSPLPLVTILAGILSLGLGGLAFAQGDNVSYLEESGTLLYEISYDQIASIAEANDCPQATLENSLLHSALRATFLYLPFEASYYADVQNLEVTITGLDDAGDPRPVLRITGTLDGIRATNTRFRSFMNGFASARAGFCFGINPDTLDLWLNVLNTRGGAIEIDPDVFATNVPQAQPLIVASVPVPVEEPAIVEPVAEEPAVVEPVAVEEPVVEEPVVEEPVVEEPAVVEPEPVEAAAIEEPAVVNSNTAYLPEGYSHTPYFSDLRVLTFAGPAEVLAPDTDYAAVVVTSKGTLVIDLFEQQAPQTVNSFVFLARNHFYDGVIFHRVLEDFMAQTGDPTGTGFGEPGYSFADEFSADLTHEGRGVVSMVNTGPDSNGSQFFITFAATPWLDGLHSIFGAVTEGAEVLDALLRIDPGQPLAVAQLNETLEVLATRGVSLAGSADQTVEAYLNQVLGTPPAPGVRLQIDAFDALIGTSTQDSDLIVGFWPRADRIEMLYIVERQR